jgi:hypothetical protein
MNWTAWCSAIGLPKATRFFDHSAASPSNRSAEPQQRAADHQALDHEPAFRALVSTRKETVRVGNAAVGELQLHVLGEIGVVDEAGRAQELQARRVAVDDEERLLALGPGENEEEARPITAGHVPLLTAQTPLVPVSNCRRLDFVEV